MTKIELKRQKRKLREARKDGVKAGVRAVKGIVNKVKVGNGGGAKRKNSKKATPKRARSKKVKKSDGTVSPGSTAWVPING